MHLPTSHGTQDQAALYANVRIVRLLSGPVEGSTTTQPVASCADGGNACEHPPVGVGAVVTEVQAAGDPCAGQPPLRVVGWYAQGGARYPLPASRSYLDAFFAGNPALDRWRSGRRGDGAVATRTLSGRRRLNVGDYTRKINTPIQGSAADGHEHPHVPSVGAERGRPRAPHPCEPGGRSLATAARRHGRGAEGMDAGRGARLLRRQWTRTAARAGTCGP